MAVGVINLRITTDLDPNSAQDVLEDNAADAESYLGNLKRFIGGLGVANPYKVTHRVDSETAGSTNNPGDSVAVTVTCDQASIVSGTDTLNFGGGASSPGIGGVSLVWETTPSDQNDVEIGADDGECSDNLAAAINAHTRLQGIFAASSDGAGVCTVTFLGPARIGDVIRFSEVGNGQTLGALDFGGDLTLAEVDDGKTYNGGVA